MSQEIYLFVCPCGFKKLGRELDEDTGSAVALLDDHTTVPEGGMPITQA